MASAAPIGKALEEATCSICLEYLTVPVTIDCGHNFCQACITQYCEQRKPESGTQFPCPECRALFQKGNFRPNRQLANIVESIKPLRLQPEKAQNENLCETHKEKLQLFCKKDGKAIYVVPIEEVAQGYKVKLQEALGPLRQALEEALELTSKEQKKYMNWQDKVENRRRSITREFKKLHQLLSEEEQLLLRRLAEEERESLQRLQHNITKLSEQSAALISLITEMEEKRQQRAAELLQGVKSTLIRSEHVKLQPPEAVSPALKNGYKICLDMREMLARFTLDVTLDPDTAHPNLVLSQDRKHVIRKTKRQNLPNNPERFDPCVFVLGAEGFTGGRHYWEVEVGDKTGWILGICKESVSRKSPDHLLPKNGYWTMCLRDGEYEALTFPAIPLHVGIKPSQVGIFLDYKAGEVSFYNVTDRSHLFTFTDTFFGTVRPFFSPCANAGGKSAAPLIICSVPAQARGNPGP
ncbi:E3 ubiquitin-protein ligase TRIM39 [Caretta caretta]|uniref:E3 ubiquitin-protein ligase TRIM39 n=1 Tax=Caretta caretta TaxID=8467 RepID=UPI00209478D9|nr:E3 ubiquitin-protein ligase TRIM39-like [Caretta caretta]